MERDAVAAAAEVEHRRLDHLQHQASALSSACDELLSDTSQRSQQLAALSQVRGGSSTAAALRV
jgi:hypothetical protein